MTEVYVDERGVLRVPLTKHTCHDERSVPCAACDEMVAYWLSFDAMPLNVRIVQPEQMSWDIAHDLSNEGPDGEDGPMEAFA